MYISSTMFDCLARGGQEGDGTALARPFAVATPARPVLVGAVAPALAGLGENEEIEQQLVIFGRETFGQHKVEGATLVWLALGPDSAAMMLHDVLADGEPEPRSAV